MPRKPGICKRGHLLTGANVYENGQCRPCHILRARARRARLMALVPGDPTERRLAAGRANFAKARAVLAEKRAARKRANQRDDVCPTTDADIARYRAEKARRDRNRGVA